MPLRYSHSLPRGAATAFAFAAAVLSNQTLFAQAGDAKDEPGTEQSEIWREIDVPPAPVLSPEEALESFAIHPGFRIELVASEPLVNDPVAITWDEDGRLWVAEMWAYMPDADGHGEDEPVSRVVVLEDLDRDGVMDRSTVFLDQLVLPRAVAIVEGGVLIADPPNLYFCQDTDGDLRADSKTVVTPYAVEGNVEHAENGLVRALDNWLYNAKSKRRFRFADGQLTENETAFRGQWGIAQDDWGRLYYNNNSLMLWGDAVPWESVGRNPGWRPRAGIQREVVADQSVFTARVNVGLNRAYREDWLREDFRMRKADAASAPTIYRGDQFPKSFHGAAFVPEPAGNVVAAYRLRDEGIEQRSEHILHEIPRWGQVEFLASSDERFRPVMTATGPDGCLYVVDMYRGILQHKTYLTSFLRKQIIDRGLDNPVGLGRIYRIVSEEGPAPSPAPKLSKASEQELVENLGHPNGWRRDTAQRLLADRDQLNPDTLEGLREMARQGQEIERIHALWTLEGRGEIDADLLLASLAEASPWTQAHVWRIVSATPKLHGGGLSDHALLAAFRDALASPHLRVRLQATASVFELLPETEAFAALLALSDEDLANPHFTDTLVSILYQRETAFAEALAERFPSVSENWSPVVADLAKALRRAKRGEAFAAELQSAAERKWPTVLMAETIARLDASERETNLELYSPEEQAQIARGEALYANICSMCHQADGNGIANVAPPLAASHWVTDSPTRLALIVAQGLEGKIEVNGQEWNLVMPAHGQHPALQDGKMADLLTYIRAAWGNNASAIAPEQLSKILESYPPRPKLWTASELRDI